jgi:hypothetical protein
MFSPMLESPNTGVLLFALCCALPLFLSGVAVGAIVRGWRPFLGHVGRRRRSP